MRSELEAKFFNRFDFFHPEKPRTETLMCFGFECGDGWFGLIWDLCEEIDKMLKANNVEGFEVIQVKEKLGGLRFYCNNSTKEIDQAINKAEEKSYTICEVCGKPGKLRNDGWLSTLCAEHAKES